MSLDKAIVHGKEKRKFYTKSKRIDKSCRNHGSCPFCQGNRTYRNKKIKDMLDEKEKDYGENKEA